jgi:membrane-bound serine protease (ClpP class)
VQLFSGAEVVLNPKGELFVDYTMTTREKFLSKISEPNFALLLGICGLILLYFEFTHPGFIAPGVIGAVCILLSILGFSFLPINYVGVLLIVLAIGLFIAEVKVQGFGVLGFGGVASMLIGILILIDAPDPAVRISLKTALGVVLPFAAIFMLLLFALLKSLRQKVSTGDAGMIGLVGIADSEIAGSGRVKVRGEYWSAFSSVPIAPGRRVKIVAIENLVLKVEEIKE